MVPTFYTTAELATMLRLHLQVIQRKLQSGEIPGYRIGHEWRVEHTQLMSWLEKHSNQRSRSQKVLDTFMDDEGRLKALPAQRSKRLAVMQNVADRFQPNRKYTEPEVNEVLHPLHSDVASLRRELVMARLLVRTPNGIYRRASARGESAIPPG